jgi:glycosyltransferase involved in cell wall biosynthesis
MGQFIGETLESVGAQTYPHWEVIVVDDAGPEDGTRAAVEAFAAKHTDHRVEYIRHEINQGVSVARRTAFESSRGKYLAFLDADDALLPEKLNKQVDALDLNGGVVLVHGSANLIGDAARVFGPNRNPTIQGRVVRTYNLLRNADAFRSNCICTSSVLCRAAVVQGDCFPTGMAHQFEDWFLWLRLAAKGDFLYEPESLVQYRVHEGGFSARSSRKRTVSDLARLEMLAAYFPFAPNLRIGVRAASAMVWSLGSLMVSLSGSNSTMKRPAVRLRIALGLAALSSLFEGRSKPRESCELR